MTIKDINDIINAVCPNDEDYEKPCISPKYLRQELEMLALEQEQYYLESNCSEIPTGSTTKNDLALIHTEGLDEEIRCTMCTNYMKSDRGCDGSCVVNNDMYKAVMDAIEKRIQTTTKNDLGVDWENYKDVDGNSLDDLILEVLQNNFDCGNTYGYEVADEIIGLLPSVTPQEPRWIPINERLPEINEEAYSKDVLLSLRRETKWDIDVCRAIHITTIGYYDVNAISSDGVYLDTEGWVLENERRLPLSDVIAWMPLPKALPKAYREVENE